MPINDLHCVASFCVVFVSLALLVCALCVVGCASCVVCGVWIPQPPPPITPRLSVAIVINHIINHRNHPSSIVGIISSPTAIIHHPSSEIRNPEPIPIVAFQSHSRMARTKKTGRKALGLAMPKNIDLRQCHALWRPLKNKHSHPAAAAHPPGRRRKRLIFR